MPYPDLAVGGKARKIYTMKNIPPQSAIVNNHLEDFSKYQTSNFVRFALQRYIQQLLFSHSIIRKEQCFYKCHRTVWASIFSVMRNPQTYKAYYDAVITCHNSKCCPVCAPRIMGVRSAEIRTAVHKWLNEDSSNTCYMLTLTFAHSATDKLNDILILFKNSLQIFWSNGSIKRTFTASGRVGRITATEIKYSRRNGFHPHQHILIFCKKTSFNIEVLRRSWLSALESSGLTGLSDIALDLIEARSCEKYLTKISSEMALGHLKDGKGDGKSYSPLQVAWAGLNGEGWADGVFVEYYRAVRGQHFLCWSRGLKKYFGINDVSDEEISQGAVQPELERFMDIRGDDFKKFDWQHKAALQNYAASNNYPAAAALLDRLGVQFWKEYAEA